MPQEAGHFAPGRLAPTAGPVSGMRMLNTCLVWGSALTACLLGWSASVQAGPRCAVVVGTNDLHGAIEPYTVTAAGGVVHAGSIVSLDSYVASLRQRFPERVVLVDGGDLYQGTLASNLSLGRAVIDAYNAVGYTASAVGNHEFDFGASPAGNVDRLSVIKERIAQARFPFLTLNIFDKATGKRVDWPNTAPSILRDIGGIKVGIMGASTPETPRTTRPQNVATLEFRDPAPLIVAEAARLRQAGAQLVVLTAHIGGKCGDLKNPNDVRSCEQPSRDAELFELLRALPPGTLDVAVGGHTHSFMAHWVNGVATIESGARGQSFGWIEACLAPGGVGIDRASSTIHGGIDLCLEEWQEGGCKKRDITKGVHPATFLGKPLAVSPTLTKTLQPYLDAVAHVSGQRIGVALPKALDVSSLANLVAESMRRVTRSDFGLQNRGGVRTDLPAGVLTYGQVFQVLPFDNMVVQIRLTGAQVERLVTVLTSRHGDAMPSLAGLTVVRSNGSVRVLTAKGQALEPTRKYTLSTNDFISQGGDGADFSAVGPDDVRVTDLDMRDAFIRLLGNLFPA